MNDEKKEFTQEMFDNMTWAPLRMELRKLLGVGVEFDRKYVERGGWKTKGIFIESENLADKAGVMSSVLKELYVVDFGGSYDKENNAYWLPLHFHWEHKDGGSNGCNLLDAFYDFNLGQWKFKMRQERW
jgi:hypothetical protein